MANPLHNEAQSLAALDLRHVLHPTTNLKTHAVTGPRILERAAGVYVWDTEGRQYLEGMAGLWCTALGYGEEELVRVAAEQMRKLSYSQLFAGRGNEPSIRLAERLASLVPFDLPRVFFGLSGSDANDTQIKLMWYYHNAIGKPQKKKIISRWRGYHGSGLVTGSLTGLDLFHKKFDLPLTQVLHTTSPYYFRRLNPLMSEAQFVDQCVADLELLIEREGADTIAAFIGEPVMGTGGIVPPPAGYWPAIGQKQRRINCSRCHVAQHP